MKMQKTFFVILIVAFLSTLMVAQQSTAKITGKVVTADGTAIPGVMVTATNPKMIGKTIAITDENGTYRLMNLKSGMYRITYELEGFATMVQPKVALKNEDNLKIPITMELKKLKETIIVEGTAPLIDVKTAAQGMTLGKETFDALPKGRDFTTLITAIPGVTNEGMLSGISVDGASGAENVFYIDGVDVTNITDGEQGQNASFDFVEEVQVKTSGYMAEYGGALGGVISAVTRSGGNEFHGELAAYYSGTALNGQRRDRLRLDMNDTTKAVYYSFEELFGDTQNKRLEAGINLGGYLLKDKVWFFGAFMPRFSNWTNEFDYDDGSGSNSLETKYKTMNYMVKLSAQIMSNVRWSASYINNWSNRRGMTPNIDGWGPFGNSSTDFVNQGFDFPNYSASTSLDITVGNNSMLNVRAGMFYTNTVNPQAPIPELPCWRFLESSQGGYSGSTNTMFPEIPSDMQHGTFWQSYPRGNAIATVANIAEKKSVNADYTLYFNLGGEHSVKIGGQFVRQGEDVDAAYQQPIIYIGWDRSAIAYGTDYGRGTYGYYVARGNEKTGAFGDKYKAYSNRFAFYLQDSWTIGEKFTLNYGVRTESEYIPSYSDNPDFADQKPVEFTFGDKMAPRLGFVYDVKGDSSLKVSGSFGLFFDVMKLDMAAGSYGGFQWKDAAYSMDDWDYTKIGIGGVFPGTELYMFDMRIPSFDTTDAGLMPMYQSAVTLSVENKLTDDISIGARFVYKHLIRTIEDVGVLTPQGEEYFTSNPGFGWSLTEASGGKFDNAYPDTPRAKRDYYGVTLNLDKRFSNNWMGGASYTWSRLEGNYSGLATSDEPGRNNPNVARYFDLWYLAFDKDLNPLDGPLPTDRTHVFKAYGSYVFPFGLTFGTVINVMSGTPVSEEWVLASEIYPYNRGNLGRTPMLTNVDLYAEYNLKLGKANLQFSVNVTNLLNSSAAQRVFYTKNQGGLTITEDQIIAADYEYPASAIPDPRYKMEFNYQVPISARLGLKLSF